METAATAAKATTSGHSHQTRYTKEQQQRILEATAELICATVDSRTPVFRDPTLGGTANEQVAGAFVSLKRRRHLRGCCGGLQEQPVELGKAVYEATIRTVTDDIRFPGVSPIELDYLDLEIWLLFQPERVTARGEERLAAVQTGGKHGLVIERGPNRGLLLPGVAADHDWDAQRFLEQTCIKAGVHPSLWKDDATAVMTFEGAPISGRIGNYRTKNGEHTPPWLRKETLTHFASFCRENLHAMLVGATPSYYAPALPDGTVNGVVLSIRQNPNHSGLHFSHLSLRPGVPLQSTLFSLVQTAAQVLVQQPMSADQLQNLEISVSAFLDPAMHGTLADPQIEGIESNQRSIFVIERGRSSIVFDRTAAPSDLLAEAHRQAQIISPPTAGVFSFEAITTEARLVVANVPRIEAGPTERPPGVAGKFYPADTAELEQTVSTMLNGKRRTKSWPAALVPHASLRFSGRIAANVLQRIKIPPTVIIIGPKHTPYGAEWAVAPHETWTIPGHQLPADPELARKLTEAIPGLVLDASAHREEHAIEVELPFIARLAPATKVVGIVIGHGDLESCRLFATGLAGVLRSLDPRPLLLISSDMNHFATDDENRRLDAMALEELEKLNPQALYETCQRHHISMCGLLPAVIVLETLKKLGKPKQAERVDYATSADVIGDKSRVVGYAGMLFG